MSLRRINHRFVFALALLVVANIANIPARVGAAAGRAEQPVSTPDEKTRASVSEAYGKLPLSFEANQGQTVPQVKFLSRGDGYNLFLTSDEAVLAMSKGAQGAALKIKLVGADAEPRVTGENELPGKSNYLSGADQSKWRTNIANYARVKYAGVYPGIDMVYYGAGRQLEYDFIVAPCADPGRIKLSMEGAQEIRLDEQGDLMMSVGGNELRQRKPFAYQEVNGVKKEVAAGYAIDGNREIGFRLGAYDKSKPLVIDPALVYSTLLGGSGLDLALGIAVDEDGFAYVTGQTSSLDFPVTAGAFQTVKGAFNDAFVTKLNRRGSALVYSTYLGGGGNDAGQGIAARGGRAYVVGNTESSDFPTTAGAFQTVYGGGQDAFVAKLNGSGSALVYSTYYGGADVEIALEIALDLSGAAYITGSTESLNLPVTPGAFQSTFGGVTDAFVAKLNGSGSALDFSTYLGGASVDGSRGIAVDIFGKAYVTGQTFSSNFPTTAGAFQTAFGGIADAFVTKLNNDASALAYSTFLGSNSVDTGQSIAVDIFGKAYVTGQTLSSDFPTTAGAFQTAFGGAIDAFVSKLDHDGSSLVYSTFLGGDSVESAQNIKVDLLGRAYVTGSVLSSNFPVTADATQATIGGGQDAFVTKLNRDGSALRFSTYLGGAGSDGGEDIELDILGGIYVAGVTTSSNFPATDGAFQSANAGASDGFVAKFGKRD